MRVVGEGTRGREESPVCIGVSLVLNPARSEDWLTEHGWQRSMGAGVCRDWLDWFRVTEEESGGGD